LTTSKGLVTIAPVIPPILPAIECFHPCSFFSLVSGGEAVDPGGVFEAGDSAGMSEPALGPGCRGVDEVVDGPGSQAFENEVEVEGAMMAFSVY
jgi:hypothetical protein